MRLSTGIIRNGQMHVCPRIYLRNPSLHVICRADTAGVRQTYNKVFIRWTTHDTGGISDKDVEMAKICDEYAASLGEKGKVAEGVTTESGEAGLVNIVEGLPK